MIDPARGEPLQTGDPLPAGALECSPIRPGPVSVIVRSPDGKLFATGGKDQLVHLWDAATGKEIRRLAGHQNWVDTLAFSPDGRLLASGSGDQTIRLWETATGKELRQFSGHKGWI